MAVLSVPMQGFYSGRRGTFTERKRMIQASIYGRLGRDPEIRTTKNGNSMASVSMACSATGFNETEDRTLWLHVVAFGRQADDLARHRQGDLISESGRMTLNVWTDKKGVRNEQLQIVVDSVISARTVRPGKRKRVKTADNQSRGKDDPMPSPVFDDDISF